MKEVFIEYNPYKVMSKITVDGDEPKHNSRLRQFLNLRFQMWVDYIPELIHEEYNTSEFDLTFHGTDLDYQDLLSAISAGEKNGIHIKAKQIPAKEFGDKENAISSLFERTRKLPFDELQSPDVADAVEKVFNDQLPVNVVATMSAGKSTLINALLGRKLMPAKSGACTATITEIQDDDDRTFKATALDEYGTEIGHYSVLDYATMQGLNNDPKVKKILVKGDIPFVKSDETSLILIDTPGTDNAINGEHGKITAKALDESSKILVLFIINGRKPHDNGQDELLRKIAKTMSVGGKQSRERFLFVISQMDTYDLDEDDIEGETIPEAIKYLEGKGIENPNIFPVAAKPALDIRRYLNTHDEKGKKVIWDELEAKVKKLNNHEQLHLEKYANLDRSSQMQINTELQNAVENNDILGQALIHSGIRGIEETIRMYVTKYCRPAKITNVVNQFSHALDAAKAFEETRKEIAQHQGEKNDLEKKINELSEKLKSKEENEAFKRKIAGLEITTKLNQKISDLVGDVQKDLRNFFMMCPEEMEEDEAAAKLNEFKIFAEQKANEFQVTVDRLLDEDIREKSQQILDEYIKKLTAISKEFSSDDLKIDLASFVQGKLVALNSENIIDNSFDTRIEKRTETRKRDVKNKYKFRERIFHISRWFDPYYTTEETYNVEVEDEVTFISREKLINQAVMPIRKMLENEHNSIIQFAREETGNIKDYFYDKFDEVDAILADKANELHKALSSKDTAEEALTKAVNLLGQLEAVKIELETILEI
ncbi:MAG: dynamin family protein [Prevotella sp.]|nr:dynamin family protein [Prevotella sp.]